MEIVGRFQRGTFEPTTRPITIINGKFYEPTKSNPPTHMMYSVIWATDVFILDPFFAETGTTLLEHRFRTFTHATQKAILKNMTYEIKRQRFTKKYGNGIFQDTEHQAILVSASFLNNQINEYIATSGLVLPQDNWKATQTYQFSIKAKINN